MISVWPFHWGSVRMPFPSRSPIWTEISSDIQYTMYAEYIINMFADKRTRFSYGDLENHTHLIKHIWKRTSRTEGIQIRDARRNGHKEVKGGWVRNKELLIRNRLEHTHIHIAVTSYSKNAGSKASARAEWREDLLFLFSRGGMDRSGYRVVDRVWC